MTSTFLTFDASAAEVAAGARYVAGGVNSNFRTGMAGGPLVFERAEGAFLYDIDGNRLIDYYGGMGAMVLGHSPATVVDAITEQVRQGILYAGQSRLEYEAAELLCSRIPSAERIRFASSGSEVAHTAMRLARAATGRRIIIKFEGHYHGWFDNIAWSTSPALNAAGPDDSPAMVAGSLGQHEDDHSGLEVLQWNDLAALEARLAKGDVAGVLMEPAMCNQGAISPLPGYLEGAREACTRHGTVLIFDEVITGFRLAAGGAQERFGVTPGLSLFAKAMANGLPTAAIAGRADIMELFSRGVLHGGTYNAHPVVMAGLIATQKGLTPEHFEQTSKRGVRLRDGIASALSSAGITAQVTGFELMFHVAFGLTGVARNYRDLARADKQGYVLFAAALLRRGVRVLERGAWFVSAAHDDAVIDETLAVVAVAAQEIAPQLR